MRILRSLAPNSIIGCILSLYVTLGLLIGTSARPAYIPSSKHHYTSVDRQGVSGASIPPRSKGRALKQYNIRAVLSKENRMTSTDQPKASIPEQYPHQRRQNIPADPNSPPTAPTGLPSASWNRKRSSSSQSFDIIATPAAARPS